ncbi:cytochrome c [Achromobacter kerstersii]
MRSGARRQATGWRWLCATAILLGVTQAIAAEGASAVAADAARLQQTAPAVAPDAAHLRQTARPDYVLQCAGCHRLDGRGSNPHGIPDFRQSVGAFVHLPEGREYLIRVPGAAHSQLSNAELAAVLNWVLTEFSAAQLPSDFAPYSEAEVAAARPNRYDDVVPVRHALARRLTSMGFTLSDYYYGSDRKP